MKHFLKNTEECLCGCAANLRRDTGLTGEVECKNCLAKLFKGGKKVKLIGRVNPHVFTQNLMIELSRKQSKGRN